MNFQEELEKANRILIAGMRAGQEIGRQEMGRRRANRFDYTQIPENMQVALKRYVEEHQPVGDFLQAVICNDLRGAFERADNTNIEIIGVYVAWFWNEAPGSCWGSRERYRAWTTKKEAEWVPM